MNPMSCKKKKKKTRQKGIEEHPSRQRNKKKKENDCKWGRNSISLYSRKDSDSSCFWVSLTVVLFFIFLLVWKTSSVLLRMEERKGKRRGVFTLFVCAVFEMNTIKKIWGTGFEGRKFKFCKKHNQCNACSQQNKK